MYTCRRHHDKHEHFTIARKRILIVILKSQLATQCTTENDFQADS